MHLIKTVGNLRLEGEKLTELLKDLTEGKALVCDGILAEILKV